MPGEKTGRVLLGLLLAAGGLWIFGKYLLPALLPVLVGAALGCWVRLGGRRLAAYTSLGERGCAVALGGLFCLLVPLALYRGALVLAGQAGELVADAAGLWRWEVLPDWLTDRLPAVFRDQVGMWVRSAVERGAGWLAGVAGGLVQALPGAALSVCIAVVSLFWWAADGGGILTSLAALVPENLRLYIAHHPWRAGLQRFLSTGVRSVGAYLRAQAAIGAVVFLLLLAGLHLLSVPSPLAWALLIAIVDLLPFLGAAAVLLPWSVFAFFGGRTALAVGLLVLAGLVWLTRQMLEPRFLGKVMGVHAWVMLAGMFVGYRLAGVWGMLGCAVLLGARREESK